MTVHILLEIMCLDHKPISLSVCACMIEVPVMSTSLTDVHFLDYMEVMEIFLYCI